MLIRKWVLNSIYAAIAILRFTSSYVPRNMYLMSIVNFLDFIITTVSHARFLTYRGKAVSAERKMNP